MPKLAASTAKRVESAEPVSGDFAPWTPGKYIATLSEVEVRKGNDSGNPYWNITWTDCVDLEGNKMPGRQWSVLMIPADEKNKPKGLSDEDSKKWDTARRMSEGRMKSFFEAMGYSTDTDTDEMIGERAVLRIGIETIKKGPKTGQQTNRVQAILPFDEAEYGDLGSAGADEDSDF